MNNLFKNGSNEICGRQALKIWRDMVCDNPPLPVKREAQSKNNRD